MDKTVAKLLKVLKNMTDYIDAPLAKTDTLAKANAKLDLLWVMAKVATEDTEAELAMTAA